MGELRGMILLAVIFGGLAGCATVPQESLTPGLGNAVKSNIAVQTVNPGAGQEEYPAATLNGQKSEQVMKEYRKEKGKTETKRLIIDMGG
jgi:type IV pilus biogenesis protein CpaD/CtpE